MPVDSETVVADLTDWFRRVQRLTEDSFFSMAPLGPHRDAVVLDALRRHARTLYDAVHLDSEGRLYSPLCFFLAAACRYLDIQLGQGHWRAALEDVRRQKQRLDESRSEQDRFGLKIETPAVLFKTEFNEVIRQTGLIQGATFLSKDDRDVAIGLAINWALRLLIAYALDVPSRPPAPSHQDLFWLAERVRIGISD